MLTGLLERRPGRRAEAVEEGHDVDVAGLGLAFRDGGIEMGEELLFERNRQRVSLKFISTD